MNLLHIIDLGEGQVQVSWQHGDAVPIPCSPVSFSNPLTAGDREELRWYLEDYLQFPYGAEEWRAGQVEKKMAEWGESLFDQVIVGGDRRPNPAVFYQQAVEVGLEKCGLCITSEEADFLNIPWELIRDQSEGGRYLAPLLEGFYRHRKVFQRIVTPELSPKEPFRILLVIARPGGDEDVPLGTVARPMLDALRPLRPRLEVELLRPPTFDEFQRKLNQRRGYYNLVHFDGHGIFVPSSGPASSGFKPDSGHLAFEKKDGTTDIVSAGKLGEVLSTSRVSLFVLNACQSAMEGKANPFSSVASQLVATGAKGTVAMSYIVYATTAAHFMRRFYESLIGHASLAEAVAAARCNLHADSDRDSMVGPIKLQDWIVPTLYQQEYRYVPIPEGSFAAVEEEQDEIVKRKKTEQVCPEGRFGFIGRDNDILRIERALIEDGSPWALLTGIGGTGKTELAFGFARWFAETGGCPGGVFVASFKEKADFGQVVGSIAGHGTDFSILPEEQQWERLVRYLREHSSLLVWDNFEPVAGYPEGAEPLATKEERDKLSGFLKALKGGKSRVLITTRKPDENWLKIAYNLIELSGLEYRDAGQMAKAILRTVGKKPEEFRKDPEYGNLLALLRGHPRSLEVILPHLRTKSPIEIIRALQQRTDKLGEAMEDASLSYAFSLLSAQTQRHLPFMGLFASYMHLDTLNLFLSADTKQDKVYSKVIGEALEAEGWEAVLEEAARNGLLRAIGNRIYELHPTLPPFFRRQLESAVGTDGLERLDAEFIKFYSSLAAALDEKLENANQKALAMATVEEANLLRALRLAEIDEQWSNAQGISQTLNEFYEICGRTDEWAALRRRLLGRVGREMAPDADRARANFWMFLLGNEANDALGRHELATAETAHHSIVDYLLALDDSAVEPKVAVGYHQLGIIAQERERFDEAEQWYKKALEILERLKLERDAASDYHQLGNVACLRQRFDEAEQWYKKALEIFERLKLERDAALDYHQLGIIAEERQRFDEAEQWYKKALEIRERLKLERYAASDYHQLGRIAEERQRFDEAEQWYKKALEILERLKLEPKLVNTLAQLGVLRRKQDRLAEAVAWFGKALTIAAEYEMRVGGQILADLARLMKAMGEKNFTAAWKQVFADQEPPTEALREIIKKLD